MQQCCFKSHNYKLWWRKHAIVMQFVLNGLRYIPYTVVLETKLCLSWLWYDCDCDYTTVINPADTNLLITILYHGHNSSGYKSSYYYIIPRSKIQRIQIALLLYYTTVINPAINRLDTSLCMNMFLGGM